MGWLFVASLGFTSSTTTYALGSIFPRWLILGMGTWDALSRLSLLSGGFPSSD
jgi:hypothetical protein